MPGPVRTWPAALPLPLDRADPAPVAVQIARGLALRMRSGALPPGAPLPGSRTLSESLGVHRNTVLAAYAELAAEGWIETAAARYGERFLGRVFTASELAYCRGRAEELAARFAAKEAASKMLGVGIQRRDGICWREIEVVSDARGKPSLNLSGRAAQHAGELGLRELALSLSHTHEYAIAFVVAE